MTAVVVIAYSAVDITSSSSSRVAIIATPELLLEHCTQLCQPLLLLLELSFKLPELL
jgi:hypothetical protein